MAKTRNNPRSIIMLLLILVLVYMFPALVGMMSEPDQLEPSDLVVVLMGGGAERMEHAAELYDSGYGDKIVMVDNYQPSKYEKQLNTHFKEREVDIKQAALLELGIPEEDIIILPGAAKNTRAEAFAMSKYLRQNQELDSLIIVGASYDTNSAKVIFKLLTRGLDREIKVLTSPVAAEKSAPDNNNRIEL